MNVSLVLAHPNPHSFNHAIASTAHNILKDHGHSVFFHDLYDEKFNPILPMNELYHDSNLPNSLKKYCDEISIADGIVIVHPNWWGQPPAILKGWIDRVFRQGVAYKFLENDSGEGLPLGLLRATTAIVFNTSNTPLQRELEVFGDPLDTLWKNCVFGLCGIKTFHLETFRVVITSTHSQRKLWIKNVEKTIAKFFPRSQKELNST